MNKFTKIIIKNKILVILLVIYFVTRLSNLIILPIFMDESIYIYWAKQIAITHGNLFISLFDGKPPLFMWATSFFLTIFPSDSYLIAGRMVSVFSGMITMFGIYAVAKKLFNENKIAFLSSLIYILFPFNLTYDRLALMDSLLTAMLIWSVYFMLKTLETFSLRYPVLWGFSLGLAFLTKPTAILFLILTPVCFLILSRGVKNAKWKKILFFAAIALTIGEIINNLLRVSKSYPLMALKNQQFQLTFQELFKNPILLLENNIARFFEWTTTYYTPFIFILGIFGFLLLFMKKLRVGFVLFLFWIAPISAFALVGKEVYPRYLLIVTPYFIMATSYLMREAIKKIFMQKNKIYKYISCFVCVILFIPMLKFDYNIIFNPPQAPFPKADYVQLISEHPSGYGLDNIFNFLDKEAKNKKITIVTEGTFGTYPYAFVLHYWNNKNVSIITRYPLANLDGELLELKNQGNAYFVLNEHDYNPGQLGLKEIIKADKPGSIKFPIFLDTFPEN